MPQPLLKTTKTITSRVAALLLAIWALLLVFNQQLFELVLTPFVELSASELLISLALALTPLIIGGYFWYINRRHNAVLTATLMALQHNEKQVVEELKHKETDFVALWAVTQERIDYYHQIATNQAKRSFISTQISIGAGFVLLIIVGFIAASADNPIAAISAGTVGIVGSGVSAYIGATFMKSQSEATKQLSGFFLQPVEFARLLSAERLLDQLETDQKTEAVKVIITAMMQPPTTPESK